MLRGAPKKWIRKNAPLIHKYWPGRITNPVFIVGCPRSGTTVLGRILGQAPRFLYLNEPRYLWCGVNPKLDIWEYRKSTDLGTLCWNAKDVTPEDAKLIAQWFHLELFINCRERLIEKTPENLFRTRWLKTIFPEAKFIHIIRNGGEVAVSLAESLSKWFFPGYWESSMHFERYRRYAADQPELNYKLQFIPAKPDIYICALFIWVCCVFEGRRLNHELGPAKYLEILYENLIADPKTELQRIFDFIREPLSLGVINYAENILRKDLKHEQHLQPDITRKIAGDFIENLGYKSIFYLQP